MQNLTSNVNDNCVEEQRELDSILEYLKQAIVETQDDARTFSRIQNAIVSTPQEIESDSKSVEANDFCSKLKYLIFELKKANTMNSITLQNFRKLI